MTCNTGICIKKKKTATNTGIGDDTKKENVGEYDRQRYMEIGIGDNFRDTELTKVLKNYTE